jgi:hypothetical protein
VVRPIQFEAAGSACGVGLVADAKVQQIDVAGVAVTAAMLDAARRAGGCFCSGITSKCVDAAQAAPPAPEGASVQVLVNLNVRAEARDDAEVVGVVPSQACVTTELCMTATDGAWVPRQVRGEDRVDAQVGLAPEPLGHRHLRQLLPQAGRLDFQFN